MRKRIEESYRVFLEFALMIICSTSFFLLNPGSSHVHALPLAAARLHRIVGLKATAPRPSGSVGSPPGTWILSGVQVSERKKDAMEEGVMLE